MRLWTPPKEDPNPWQALTWYLNQTGFGGLGATGKGRGNGSWPGDSVKGTPRNVLLPRKTSTNT